MALYSRAAIYHENRNSTRSGALRSLCLPLAVVAQTIPNGAAIEAEVSKIMTERQGRPAKPLSRLRQEIFCVQELQGLLIITYFERQQL